MVRRLTPIPAPPILNVEQMRRRVERLKVCIQELRDFDPQKVQKRYGIPEVMALEAAIEEAVIATPLTLAPEASVLVTLPCTVPTTWMYSPWANRTPEVL